ncbi:probable cadmium/zinc-transporting ATPase HMA1, chloroplastic, partial [Tanacetum coccineum]
MNYSSNKPFSSFQSHKHDWISSHRSDCIYCPLYIQLSIKRKSLDNYIDTLLLASLRASQPSRVFSPSLPYASSQHERTLRHLWPLVITNTFTASPLFKLHAALQHSEYPQLLVARDVHHDCQYSQRSYLSTITIEHLTGEVKPVERDVGYSIPGGARNIDDSSTPLEPTPSIDSKIYIAEGGHVFDSLASCHTIAFDKTGTLTTGEFTCKAIEPIHGHVRGGEATTSCCVPTCEREALAVAAVMEKGTTHPISRAVINHSQEKALLAVYVESFENLPGRGLYATLSSLEPGFGNRLELKASLGSVEYITSQFNSKAESQKITEAVIKSSHETDLVRGALSVNNKKIYGIGVLCLQSAMISKNGVRISLLVAPMPTASTSQILKGLETGMHYLRSRAEADAIKFTVDTSILK